MEVLDDAVDAARTAERQSEHDRPTDGDRISTESERLHDIGPAADAAVEDERDLALHFIGNRRQHGDRSGRAIECPAAVIGYLYGAGAGRNRSARILGPRQAF